MATQPNSYITPTDKTLPPSNSTISSPTSTIKEKLIPLLPPSLKSRLSNSYCPQISFVKINEETNKIRARQSSSSSSSSPSSSFLSFRDKLGILKENSVLSSSFSFLPNPTKKGEEPPPIIKQDVILEERRPSSDIGYWISNLSGVNSSSSRNSTTYDDDGGSSLLGSNPTAAQPTSKDDKLLDKLINKINSPSEKLEKNLKEITLRISNEITDTLESALESNFKFFLIGVFCGVTTGVGIGLFLGFVGGGHFKHGVLVDCDAEDGEGRRRLLLKQPWWKTFIPSLQWNKSGIKSSVNNNNNENKRGRKANNYWVNIKREKLIHIPNLSMIEQAILLKSVGAFVLAFSGMLDEIIIRLYQEHFGDFGREKDGTVDDDNWNENDDNDDNDDDVIHLDLNFFISEELFEVNNTKIPKYSEYKNQLIKQINEVLSKKFTIINNKNKISKNSNTNPLYNATLPNNNKSSNNPALKLKLKYHISKGYVGFLSPVESTVPSSIIEEEGSDQIGEIGIHCWR